MNPTFWTFRITALHLMENLASELYGSSGDCLWELVRNAVVACMPNDDVWKSKVGDVTITLEKNHPLASARGQSVMVILDRGRGFTDPAIARYCSIGPTLSDRAGRRAAKQQSSGASQKRIGRFAAFALNQATLDGDVDAGFYILTRTTKEGPVKFVSMIPSQIERDQGVQPRDVDATGAELGSLRGFKGSFTAIVIPNPVFSSTSEIVNHIRWRIPRKPDLAFALKVDKEVVQPPPLFSKVTVIQQQGGSIEAYLDRLTDPKGRDGGIWFVDAATGLRVAFAPRLGPTWLPYPLHRSDLVGDIFVPGLLANQDTARSTLKTQFLRSKQWKKAILYLVGQVVGPANSLLDDEDKFGQRGVDSDVLQFVELCRKAYGVPDEDLVGPVFLNGDNGRRTATQSGNRKSGSSKGASGPRPNPPTRPTKPRAVPFRIGDESYLLQRRSLDSLTLAEVDATNGQVIHFNSAGYECLPTTKQARAEHVLLAVLAAVGRYRYPGDVHGAARFVAQCRQELLRGKRST